MQLVNVRQEGSLLQLAVVEAQAPPGWLADARQLSQTLEMPLLPLPPVLEPMPLVEEPRPSVVDPMPPVVELKPSVVEPNPPVEEPRPTVDDPVSLELLPPHSREQSPAHAWPQRQFPTAP